MCVLKASADDKIYVTEKVTYVLGWMENIVRRRENAGLPAFSSFSTMFSKSFFSRLSKVGILW